MNAMDAIRIKARFKLWAPWRADRHPSFYLSHSQFGEDMAVRAIFGDRRYGTFVDLGAHHPVYFSNTYHFYRKGWRGLNVDALPGSMKLFELLRPHDINVEAALAPHQGQTLTYFMFDQPACNTLDPVTADAHLQSNRARLVERRTLACMTLVDCLDKHLGSKHIDLMTIDLEGMDEAILRSNEWTRYRPDLLILERRGLRLNAACDDSLIRYLSELGYELEAKCGPSFILRHAPA